ncbi:MAG: hypothetical protein KF788_13035 [Piscinibacter sp.]|nr:hypothetical protein [Piscinibacter sp.]
MKRVWRGLGAVVLAMVLAACGGGSDPAPTPSGAATIGTEGGQLVTGSAEVLVPAGAMTTPATIRIAADATGAPALPAWASGAGDMLQITPHGSTFNEPVTVSLRAPNVTLAADERLVIAKAQPGGDWEILMETTQQGDMLEVQVTSFSYFVPVIVRFPAPTLEQIVPPLAMSPLAFDCNGTPCRYPLLIGSDVVVTASSTGNGGAFPDGCRDPQMLLTRNSDRYVDLATQPATPAMTLTGPVQIAQEQLLFALGRIRLEVRLRCTDANDRHSTLVLRRDALNVDEFGRAKGAPAVRQFPARFIKAPGESLAFRAILTGGSSYLVATDRFEPPSALDWVPVYLEVLAPGETAWRVLDERQQLAALPHPTGALDWAYWAFDYDLGAVTESANGTRYRLRACLSENNSYANSKAAVCATGPEATLTVVQQAGAPAFGSQPASLLVQTGQTASFDVFATGAPPPALQWQTRAPGASAWTDVAGATSSTLTTAAATLADNGRQYRAVASNAAGSVTSAAAMLSVNDAVVAPSIVTQPTSLTVVLGSEALFAVTAQGTAALSYQWLRNGVAIAGANAPQLKLPTVGVGDAATYAVRVSNAAGSALSAAAPLTLSTVPVDAAPSIVTQPAAVAVNEGHTATFAVGVTGSGPLSFQWLRNGTTIAGANTAVYTIAAVASADAASYSVVVDNAAGSATSAAAALSVTPASGGTVAPTITAQPASVVALPLSTTTLAVAASGSAPLSYQWFRDGAPVAGATGPTLTFGSLDPATSGLYTVTVGNTAGSVTSAPAQLLVVGAPQITAQPQAASAVEGASATFVVQASGEQLRYQWTRNGVAIDGATASSLTTPSLALADNGAVYTVIVYNGAGLVTSGGAVLTVTAAPPPVSISAAGTLAAGNNHSCALRADGRVACWGSNVNGQLGNGSFGATPVATPVVWNLAEPVKQVAAGATGSCALTATSGRVFCSGFVANAYAPTELAGFSGVKGVAMGAQHACLIASDDAVWCWGSNGQYELGTATTTGSFTPVRVLADVGVSLTGALAIDSTNRHSCALMAGGTVRCWGQNSAHQLGYNPFGGGDPGYAREVPGLSGATQVSAGAAHSCALIVGGSVQCWGDNNLGQIGQGIVSSAAQPITAPTAVQNLGSVAQIAAGIRHTCARLADDSLRCWGTGYMGNASGSETATLPVAVSGLGDVLTVDAGDVHTCVLRPGGNLSCWGGNGSAQLGTGDTDERLVPTAHAAGALFWAP